MGLPPAFHESLPYVDPEPTPDALSAARALIAAEEAAYTSPSSHLPPLSAPKFTPLIETELARVASSTPLSPLDLSRYEAQEPPPPSSTEPGSSASTLEPTLATAAVSQAYLAGRAQNLSLLDRWGRHAWLLGNDALETELKALEAELAETKAEVDRVNIERQKRQAEVAAEMTNLEEGWRKGVGRVLETEVAVEELKRQIRDELRKRAIGQGTAASVGSGGQ